MPTNQTIISDILRAIHENRLNDISTILSDVPVEQRTELCTETLSGYTGVTLLMVFAVMLDTLGTGPLRILTKGLGDEKIGEQQRLAPFQAVIPNISNSDNTELTRHLKEHQGQNSLTLLRQEIVKPEPEPQVQDYLNNIVDKDRKAKFEQEHQAELKKIEDFRWKVHGQDIYLTSLDASGGGAAAFRELFVLRQRLNLTGDIYLNTPGSESNIFYLYMGMVPFEHDFRSKQRVPYTDIKMDYLDTFFPDNPKASQEARTILNAFEKGDQISDADKNVLKLILHKERTKWGHQLAPDHTLITDDDLITYKAILLEIRDKQVSKLEGEFIPVVLTDMRNNLKSGEKRIILHGTTPLWFKMTAEGFKRADDAIAKNEKIKPFKMLEHLPLTPDQRDELQQIMQAKAAGKDEVKKTEPTTQATGEDKKETKTSNQGSATTSGVPFSENRFGTPLAKIVVHPDKNESKIVENYTPKPKL